MLSEYAQFYRTLLRFVRTNTVFHDQSESPAAVYRHMMAPDRTYLKLLRERKDETSLQEFKDQIAFMQSQNLTQKTRVVKELPSHKDLMALPNTNNRNKTVIGLLQRINT